MVAAGGRTGIQVHLQAIQLVNQVVGFAIDGRDVLRRRRLLGTQRKSKKEEAGKGNYTVKANKPKRSPQKMSRVRGRGFQPRWNSCRNRTRNSHATAHFRTAD